MKYIINYAASIASAIFTMISVFSFIGRFILNAKGVGNSLDSYIIIFNFFTIVLFGTLSILFLVSGILKQIKEEEK